MESGKQKQQQYQCWKLNVQAKAKKLNFKFAASTYLPNSKFFNFSFKFKYCRFLVYFKSEPQIIKKSRLHRLLQKLRIPTPNHNIKAKTKATIPQSSVVVGNLALFIQSIYQGDKDAIFIVGSIVFLCFASLLKNFTARKSWKWLVFLIGAVVFYSNLMHLRLRSSFDHHYMSRFFWKAFNYAASSSCLYILSKVLTAISRVI